MKVAPHLVVVAVDLGGVFQKVMTMSQYLKWVCGTLHPGQVNSLKVVRCILITLKGKKRIGNNAMPSPDPAALWDMSVRLWVCLLISMMYYNMSEPLIGTVYPNISLSSAYHCYVFLSYRVTPEVP